MRQFCGKSGFPPVRLDCPSTPPALNGPKELLAKQCSPQVREDARRVCEVKIAVKALNRTVERGRPICVRVA
jgi:hypothetical protein